MIVNMHEAKTRLSELAERFEQGEEVVVARNGKPIFRFAPIQIEAPNQRKLGFFKCKIDMTHFDDPIEDMEAYQ